MNAHIAIAFGGRDYSLTPQDAEWLHSMWTQFGFRILLHGGCTGADTGAAEWARNHGLCDAACPAQWDEFREKFGRPHEAGPHRNHRMAAACQQDGLRVIGLAFPGGSGTHNMRSRCYEYGIQVYDSPGHSP